MSVANVEAVVRDYVQGYLGADGSRVGRAFHPETRLYSVDEGKLARTEMSDWLANLEARKQKGDVRQAELEIDFVDVAGDSAVAKIRLRFASFIFTDYLSLLKVEGAWRIVGKIYTASPLN